MAQKPTQTTEKPPEAEQNDPKVSLTISQIQSIVDGAVEKALADFPRGSVAPPGPRRMTNADLRGLGQGPRRQTQEDVTTLAISVGPVTHESGFIPAVPEYVAQKDMDEHVGIIGKLTAMGYVVSLIGVEFHARWEPTEPKQLGDHVVNIRVVRPQPEEGKPILQILESIDARHSRIFIQSWLNRRTITGDRQIDELAAQDEHGISMSRIRDGEVHRLEAGERAHLDNVGLSV